MLRQTNGRSLHDLSTTSDLRNDNGRVGPIRDLLMIPSRSRSSPCQCSGKPTGDPFTIFPSICPLARPFTVGLKQGNDKLRKGIHALIGSWQSVVEKLSRELGLRLWGGGTWVIKPGNEHPPQKKRVSREIPSGHFHRIAQEPKEPFQSHAPQPRGRPPGAS